MKGLFFLFIITTTAAHAQSGNPPPLSSANTTNSDRAVLINSNYDGSATSANEFIYFRSGTANRNDPAQANSWFKNSQLVVADTMVAAFRKTGSGGVFKLNNRGGTSAGSRWWLGFGGTELIDDILDIARIGVESSNGITADLIFNVRDASFLNTSPDVEEMRITSSGNIGIGTSTPVFKLDVNGTARVNKFMGGTGPDLSIIADGGKQSVISSWHALQLVGNRKLTADYTPENTGGLNDASVIIPNQQADKIGLIVQGKSSQTGNLLELRNSSGTKLSSFSADGRLCIQCGPSFTTTTTLLELGVDNSGVTTQLLRVHGGAAFNNELAPDELTQVSINTNFRVDSAALTVAGPAYIGSWQTAQANPKKDYLKNYMLWVEKGIVTEDVAYAPKADWADYVFSNDYQLTPLADLKAYIQQHQHLPGVKSAGEVAKNGYTSHDFNKTILAKVEELTLYIIEQEKKIVQLKQELNELKK